MHRFDRTGLRFSRFWNFQLVNLRFPRPDRLLVLTDLAVRTSYDLDLGRHQRPGQTTPSWIRRRSERGPQAVGIPDPVLPALDR